MSKLTLKSALSHDYICLSKIFIKEYMPKASGEFLKIYLYMLCCLSDGCELSVSAIADYFDLTEKDVLRAIKYWTNEQVITTEDNGKELTSITFLPLTGTQIGHVQTPVFDNSVSSPVVNSTPATPMNEAASSDEEDDLSKPEYSSYDIAKIKRNHSDFDSIIYVIQKNIKSNLSQSDLQSIVYLMDILKYDYDMMEELVNYCLACDKKSIRYMEAVARSWHKKGYTTVEEVRNNCTAYKKAYGAVMKAFGIKRRDLSPLEIEYIEKWLNEYQFTEDFITEACQRTVVKTHEASFPYADSILKDWKKQNIKTFDDIKRCDELHEKASKTASKRPVSPKLNTTFNNITKIDHDFELMEINNTRKLSGLPPLTRSELDELKSQV